ncbi:hypothetical protein G4B88_009955 [Cannabis sativa]|uniref:SWIM-type domain-containing protein n=1 Tax=Cannabis sativa TaxID=3483 RepID=A0A7J6DP43_CANSA|nr:hypothetical protein G4B88_009955 [Cannabis sativa]
MPIVLSPKFNTYFSNTPFQSFSVVLGFPSTFKPLLFLLPVLMARPKLILICQSLGKFVTNEDGTLLYAGGEAHAVDITPETLFNDLKLKLAEMWNLAYESLSIKYFLPGNRRTLITLANDKDLKRMYEFHGNSVTADVYIQGKAGFDREALSFPGRTAGLKEAEAIMPVAACVAAAPTNSDIVVTPLVVKHSISVPSVANLTPVTPVSSFSHTTSTPGAASSTPPDSTSDANAKNSPSVDMDSTPAETVKKRRRAASRKGDANGPTIVANTNDGGKKRKTTPRRKSISKRNTDAVEDDVEQKQDNSSGNAALVSSADVPPERLMELWKDGITGVGQEFKSVYEFREALQRYAIAHRFMYRLKKNDTNRASGRCIAEDCSWKIYASWDSSTQSFKIKNMNETHTCGGKSWESAHPAKNWVVSIIKDRLQDSPHHKPKQLAKSILQDFGVELNYTQVWRGIGDARQQLHGSYKEAYNQLPWLCEKMTEANPGSLIKLFISDEKRFERLFLSFHASIHGFQIGCRPILFLEATSMKSKFHEVLLTASALDGDDSVFPVAFGVVDNENNDNWQWFLEQLKSVLLISQSITFVSDREKELKSTVLNLFENAHHAYSIYHLLESFKRSSKGPFNGEGKNSLPINFLAAAHAIRLDTFKLHTEQIKKVSSQAYDWLMDVEQEYWTSTSFKGEPYNHVTLNVAETYTKWMEEVREAPIVQKIELLQCKTMELINTGRTDSSKWCTKLTPLKEQKLREQRNKAYGHKVLFSSDTLFEVHGDSTNVVNVETWSCSCLGWKRSGLPCSHAVAVFSCTGRNIYDYCSRYFTADSFRLTYSETINSVNSNMQSMNNDDKTKLETTLVLPPVTSRSPTQNKKKESETGAVKRVRPVTCTRCKETGHNKATCKAN